jgi:hypothetical protein
MKQVVGGTFCGIQNESLEDQIIKDLAQKSISYVYNENKSEAFNEARARDARNYVEYPMPSTEACPGLLAVHR